MTRHIAITRSRQRPLKLYITKDIHMSSQPTGRDSGRSRQTRESRQIDLLKSQVQRWEIVSHQFIGQLETQKEFLIDLSDKLEFMSNMLQEEQ